MQLTLRATLVDGRPVIAASRSPEPLASRRGPPAGASVVALGPVAAEAAVRHGRDAMAKCEACGAQGTVGRAARTDAAGTVTEMHRFCIDCWPEQSARYRARWDEEDRRRRDDFLRGRVPVERSGPGSWFEAATWHGALEIVRQVERSLVALVPPATDDLAQLAANLREQATELEGEMPWEVEAFLQRYGTPAA